MSPAQLTMAMVIWKANYMSIFMFAAVGYDYILKISDEIEYIWTQPWTWVSTLFVLVRYAGLCSVVISAICQIMFITYAWSFCLFVCAADFVMILRVWVMYNRSRLVLYTLLVSFSLEVISAIVACVAYSSPGNLSTSTVQVFNLSYCTWQITPAWMIVASALQMIHGTALCTMATAQFVGQSLQMYRATRRWQINMYMNLFVKHGIVYFFALLPVAVANVLSISGSLLTQDWPTIASVIMFTLTPRFILSVRELYARDVQGGCRSGVDTGFGISSSHDIIETMIAFADIEENERTEEVLEISKEGRPSDPV